jgi:hypothetical protein
VTDHDLAGAPDGTVMALALEQRATLVTYDADFAAMLVLGEAASRASCSSAINAAGRTSSRNSSS